VAGRQVHDANIVATMLANGITRLLTFNVADFRRFAALISVETL
jgi:predicted nucleic acid-binding protein